jgi:hypothetical protein
LIRRRNEKKKKVEVEDEDERGTEDERSRVACAMWNEVVIVEETETEKTAEGADSHVDDGNGNHDFEEDIRDVVQCPDRQREW